MSGRVDQSKNTRGFDNLSDAEWKIIEERAARRDLASDEEVEALFRRFRDR